MNTLSIFKENFSEKRSLYKKFITKSNRFFHKSQIVTTINSDKTFETLSSFTKSSFSKKNNLKSYKLLFKPNLTLKDSEALSSIYTSKNYEDNEKEISIKYNLNTDLSLIEKDEIRKIFKIKNNNQNKSINTTSHQTKYGNEYLDPFNSKQVLNLNNDIYQKVNTIRLGVQYEEFQKKINELSKRKHLINLMPKIRISRLTNSVTKITKQLSKPLSGIANNNKYITEKNVDLIKKKLPPIKYQIQPFNKLKNDIVIFPSNIFTQYHPSSRGQFALCTTENGTIYVFGGLQSKSFSEMWVCQIRKKSFVNKKTNLEQENEFLTWEKIGKAKEDECPLPRYGHSMTYYRDYLYIFGGNVIGGSLIRNREENITIYDIKKEIYYYPKCHNYKIVQWRRNHIGIGIGNNILIHGGINDEGEFLDDLLLFECLKFKWIKLSYKSLIKIPKIAFHTGVLVIKNQDIIFHNDLNIYKFPEGSISKNKRNKIKIEGIYIFGGIEKEGNFHSNLWLIRIGVKPVDIINVPSKGKQPPPRILCGMTFFSPLNILVVYGGRNQFISETQILNDIWIFDLESFTWIIPVYDIGSFYPICEHCMFTSGERIIFLGGSGNNGLEKFDLNTIEFELFTEKPIFDNKNVENLLN